MSFNFIVDPATLESYSIFSKDGVALLKKYVKEYQIGGSAAEPPDSVVPNVLTSGPAADNANNIGNAEEEEAGPEGGEEGEEDDNDDDENPEDVLDKVRNLVCEQEDA